jgi:hypothetical protein
MYAKKLFHNSLAQFGKEQTLLRYQYNGINNRTGSGYPDTDMGAG